MRFFSVDAPDEERLLEAAEEGDVEEVRRLLDAGVHINPKNRDAVPFALRYAAAGGHLAVVELLLKRGADVNARSISFTALVCAARHGHYAVVELLLDMGADVNLREDLFERAPLLEAAWNGHVDVAELLLKRGADVTSVDSFGWTAVHVAQREGQPDVLEVLLENGAEIDAKDNYGNTALHLASRWNQLDIVQLLVEKGADVNVKDDNGWTALHCAVKGGDLAVVKLLLEKADVDAKDDVLGFTALHLATSYDRVDIVALLLEKGADVNAQDAGGGVTALIDAEMLGHTAVVDANDEVGLTALHWAVGSGRIEVAYRLATTKVMRHEYESHFVLDLDLVKLLLDKGTDVHAKDKRGDTALHTAASRGDLAVVKMLEAWGANVNAKNNDGDTPLRIALLCSKKEVAYFLLEHGAVAVIGNNERLTPLDAALRPKNGEPDVDLICRMLLPSGALVQLATDGLEAHEMRLKRIVKGLKRAVQSPGFLSDLADTLAGIDATGCVRGTGAMLKALLRQLDAFATAAGDGAGAQEPDRAPKRRRLGEAYMARRGRHRLAVVRAVQSADFLYGLAEGLAGVNLFASDPGAPIKLVSAGVKLDALSAEGAQV